ncbi:alpha-amylase family glycosyl hydrolase [Erythrobacter sp. JK5]|uniref:alpha-amylase family glycosyl hydrolase n=1 Tax=Erythrobacter sp. JK5 TaxID=2829500 RepID=UPI001BA95BBE|nr:alpha-amylase family glycosyl hydrolase [Erythrobacter sp. JK5]QUL38173.1 alpha-amylase [Erythrobacter sp. JK5]
MKRILLPILGAAWIMAGPGSAMTEPPSDVEAGAGDESDRQLSDEVIYFVLPDRFANGDTSNDLGGIAGDRLTHGFDPTHKGFYHGGDLAGLTEKLDYIEGMGVTAIWFAPVFKNKPVQGDPGQESAGYHGYWVTDFTSIDPHFGTNEEFEAFVEAAHARGMKVYMDIITNHTADVIGYAEGAQTGYTYRSKADFPYSRRGGPDGEPINEGFAGDDVATAENWARLTDATFAYTPVIAEAERNVKVPAWLNDPIYYHNRGNSAWVGESSVYGDFAGLDDLATEHPRVVDGMIEIFGDWIERTKVDGFRIDTAKHVNPEFWQKFVPAMMERAETAGIPDFRIFGEVYSEGPNSGFLAQFTRRDGFPAVLDFAFQSAVRGALARDASPAIVADMLAGDVNYEGGEEAALAMPIFLGNHDMGRFSTLVKADNPGISQEELLDRVLLGHAMMFTLRGSPVIYYGDEQGFVGDGNDQLARENMFPSLTEVYNDNDLIGTDATTADDNFDTLHPIYRTVAALAEARKSSPALRRGLTIVRGYDHEGPGLLALERHDPASGERVLVVFNTSGESISRNVEINYRAAGIAPLLGQCPADLAAPGVARIVLPAFGYAACVLEEGKQ